ncbi:DUF5689 domain-containing protein [Pedobacter sp. GR22-10]|uniref:DUF5689 domain-containing protein n=1 Tax=Pedobacter sp. GR22-10 TaxID=2994472 RepID=UPI0022476847|nr:DUF5689 domain-containing protein [Pedobacter sp. GR22-10]MCX2430251.1 DUF5689 domain-containing protein [Pedobacter sp. GR22-10]
MKKIIYYMTALLLLGSTFMSCKRDSDYVSVSPSPFIANFDLRKLYKNTEIQLNTTNLSGASSIRGVVISDQASGNIPAGLLIVQNSRITGSGIDSLRGIAINIGTASANYVPGDSVHVKIDGSTMKRVDGILQLTGVNAGEIKKISSGRSVRTQAVNTATLISRPDFYESTLITISKGVTAPEPVTGDTFSGNKVINDGFGKATIHTEATAQLAKSAMVPFADFTGIVFRNSDGLQLWPRTLEDIYELDVIKVSPLVVTGYLTDPDGSDANNEYIQFKATRDINFAVTPMSIVTSNNAGITAAPTLGWAMGGVRTYKFNITTGSVKKGQFCYVGGSNKKIWGSASTDISNAVWIAAKAYSTLNGDDFGTATTNLLANSGNVAGIAVFDGTTVSASSVPLDVVMFGGGGSVYTAGPPEVGYRITNTDKYSVIQNRKRVNFYGGGTNTSKYAFPATSNFTMLGGIYDATTGLWSTGRVAKNVELKSTSQLSEIQQATGFTVIVN